MSIVGNEKVNIIMPKFKFEKKYFMGNTLAEMGMPTAFSPGEADFSGMDGSKNLYLGFVIHQAYVDVNEEGTEAAAATAAGIQTTAIHIENYFKADHSFVFIIQDKETGSILFMGRVENPAA